MALIYEGDKVIREIIQEDRRAFPLLATREGARIVLNTRAIAYLLQHLDIIFDTALYPLRLYVLAVRDEVFIPLILLLLYCIYCPVYL